VGSRNGDGGDDQTDQDDEHPGKDDEVADQRQQLQRCVRNHMGRNVEDDPDRHDPRTTPDDPAMRVSGDRPFCEHTLVLQPMAV
jgi:hypothetical protein